MASTSSSLPCTLPECSTGIKRSPASLVISGDRAGAFVEAGGTLEGIQLWVNLPAEHKMVQPAYQEFRAADLTEVSGTGWRLVLVSRTLPWREGHGADGE